MTASKPAIVIVPGGWHPSSSYESLARELKELGFAVVTADLPSLNPAEPHTTSCAEDSKAVRKVISSIIDEGKDLIVLNHSYGGLPGSSAAHGLSKSTYSKMGKPGGVIGIIHLTAFVVPEGFSIIDFGGGHHPGYLRRDQPSSGLCIVDSPATNFYHDVDTEGALALEKALLPHATFAFESPSPPTAWQDPGFEGRLAFLRCTEDKALPPFVQDIFMEKSKVNWMVKDIAASHSAYASRPKEVAEVVAEWADVFLSKV